MNHSMRAEQFEGGKLIGFFEDALSKSLSIKDVKIPYRSLNHWDSKGLLLDVSRHQGHWRRFNFIEYIWLKIIVELREYGFALEKIGKVKDALTVPVPMHFSEMGKMESVDEVKLAYYNPLFLLIVEAVLSREPIHVLINTRADCIVHKPGLHEGFDKDYADFARESYLTVSINGLIVRFLMMADEAMLRNELDFLYQLELSALLELRSGACTELTVSQDETEVFNLHEHLEQERERAFLDALFNRAYDDFYYETADGQQIKFTRPVASAKE